MVENLYNYMSREMNSDLIEQRLISLKLFNQDELHIIVTAASKYQKNCLILEKVRSMDMASLKIFCRLLESIPHQKHLSDRLTNGKNYVLLWYNIK